MNYPGKWYLAKVENFIGQTCFEVYYEFPPKHGPDPRSLRRILEVIGITDEEAIKSVKELGADYRANRLKSQQIRGISGQETLV